MEPIEGITPFLSEYGSRTRILKRLHSCESDVFIIDQDGNQRILKIASTNWRSIDSREGECEWISYLISNGVRACAPVPTRSGRHVTDISEIKADSCIYLFERSDGVPMTSDLLDRDLLFGWGKTLGMMHRLSAVFSPSRENHRRHSWYSDPDYRDYKEILDDMEQAISNRLAGLLEATVSLPTTRDRFGLIHADPQFSNILLEGRNLRFIDFDDCCYDWFMNDIAVAAFYHVVNQLGASDISGKLTDFLKGILDGYRTEMPLPDDWPETIPLFMKIRELILYIALKRQGQSSPSDPWSKNYLDIRKTRAARGIDVCSGFQLTP